MALQQQPIRLGESSSHWLLARESLTKLSLPLLNVGLLRLLVGDGRLGLGRGERVDEGDALGSSPDAVFRGTDEGEVGGVEVILELLEEEGDDDGG